MAIFLLSYVGHNELWENGKRLIWQKPGWYDLGSHFPKHVYQSELLWDTIRRKDSICQMFLENNTFLKSSLMFFNPKFLQII